MAPLVPRMHLFEIDDQPWFPSFLRAYVQAALTEAWRIKIPGLQVQYPAKLIAKLLHDQLADSIRDYVFIDFCAGAGGPTPLVERLLNEKLSSETNGSTPSAQRNGHGNPSYAAVAAAPKHVQFVLTDLHPHVQSWEEAAKKSSNISYVTSSVDAAHASPELIQEHKSTGKKVFRLFNLAFHHFDDPLAKAILGDTVENSDGFAIFELQDRSFLGFLSCCVFGLGIMLMAPYFAFKWRAPLALFFTYVIPILPFVLVFDGWMSSLRTRTPQEVEALLRSCGAKGGSEEIGRWKIKSGKAQFLWQVGYLNYIVCVKE